MKKNKKNEVDFEFDYNNYLEKSSQGRYTELEEEHSCNSEVMPIE